MSHPFKQLGVPVDLVQGLEPLGIHKPTKIQADVIPFLLDDGGDLIAQAQTGTGKTAAFGLPLLTKVDPKSDAIQGVVIAPTRELAKQIGKALFRFTKFSDKIFIEVLAGGDPMDRQAATLRRPTQIVVATPGRLLDLIKRKALQLDTVRHLVLDEADEMLSMGFRKELSQIIELTKKRTTTWLFSATFPEEVDKLTKGCMGSHPRTVKVDRIHVVNRSIKHLFVQCPRSDKTAWIVDFLERRPNDRGLIFCRTKAGAIGLGRQLEELGYPVDVLQGDLSQKERDKIMRAFREARIQCLIATDVMARGIHVDDLAFVLHHQLPDQTEYYTHRSGRTARAGKKGLSVVLLDPRERRHLSRLEKELGLSFAETR